MSRFEDVGVKLETPLRPNAIFNHCPCGNGVIANGIVLVGVLKEYHFMCASCNRQFRMGPTGRLYKIATT